MQSFNPSSISFTDAAVSHFKNSLNGKPESFGIELVLGKQDAPDMNISSNTQMKNKKEIFYLINHPLRSMLTAIVLNS